MVRIYKRTDRIAVKIDDVTVKLAPLSLDQKTEIQMLMLSGTKSTDLKKMSEGICLSIKYSLKGIEGIVDSDGNPYRLSFDANDNLKDECIDDLMNLELKTKLVQVCSNMVKGIPTKFTDEQDKALEGVELVTTKSESEAKK